ncbi:hypothetical protein [Endozoicomonas arenosclerae]|uniref:hypothetical protein n=1 Tax=Endozoicomonas arenosclerae TaxID=1633495 RepID=UPI000AE436B1|nr:hypothetical protein [Endozoicomonas arenosclerae]
MKVVRQALLISTLLPFLITQSYAESSGPLFGKEWIPEGTDFPKTWGISLTTLSMKQNSKLDSVVFQGDIGRYITDLQFNKVEDESRTTNLRVDAWVLPFLNLYLMYGYMEGETQVNTTTTFDITPNLPGGIQTDNTTTLQKYHGDSWGLGATLVYGSGPWSASLDINATRTELNVVRSKVNAIMATPRLGYTTRIADIPVTWTAGVSYLWLDQRITVEQSLPGLDTPMVMEMDVKADNPWSPMLGASLQFTDNWHAVFEAGFDGRQTLMGTLTYRFD